MRFREFFEALSDLPDAKDLENDKKDIQPEKAEEPKEDPKPELKTLADLFNENKSAIKTFMPKKVYDAKRIEDSFKGKLFTVDGKTPQQYTSKDDDYLIRDHDNINKTWLCKNEDYNKLFVALSSVQRPDAEGFIKVRRNVKLDAYLYTGEDQKLKDGKTITGNTYIFRLDGSNAKPVMLDKTAFEADYELGK